MTPSEREALDRLARLAATLAPRLADAYLRALALIRDGVTLAALERAARDGPEAVVRLILDSAATAAAADILRQAWTPAVLVAAGTTVRTAPRLQGLRVTLRPGGGFVEAEDAARRLAVDRFRNLTDDLAGGFRATVADGIARGVNPRETARAIRSMVGFTDYDVGLVRSFRAQLEAGDRAALARTLRDRRMDGALRRAVAGDGTLSKDKIDRMVAAYERRLRAWRAETWSRTAALDASREGQLAAWRAARERGILTLEVVKRWVTRLDGRERDAHRAANGQVRGLDEPFLDPSVGLVDYPGQGTYNCRCAVVVVPADG